MRKPETLSLKGKLLIAAPDMKDPRFANAVIYICDHNAEHAMGLVINKTKGTLNLADMFDQIGIEGSLQVANSPVLEGGPVDIDRGFVLHTPDYTATSSVFLSGSLRMTATKDILESLVLKDKAPQKAVLAVGYSGWTGGQIEEEIKQNAWFIAEGDEALIYDTDMGNKWRKALASLGIKPERLSPDSGLA